MRSHLGCTGSVELGRLSTSTQNRLEQVAASWLEFSPESASLVVRHVQPDDVPALREIAGELLDFLHTLADSERNQIPGGELHYLDEPTGQYVRLKVRVGGSLAVAWARPDYSYARWALFQNQPVTLVFEPYQRLNGEVTFAGQPKAAADFRRIIEKASGQYSQGECEISSSGPEVRIKLHDVNVDALTTVNALRYTAQPGTLSGEIDVSSFRAGDWEDYCRFSFRDGETWMARPELWPEGGEQ